MFERSWGSRIIEIVGLATGLSSSSSSSSLSLVQPQGSPTSVYWLNVSICHCLSQQLATPTELHGLGKGKRGSVWSWMSPQQLSPPSDLWRPKEVVAL